MDKDRGLLQKYSLQAEEEVCSGGAGAEQV
jgi:hypothetical protein